MEKTILLAGLLAAAAVGRAQTAPGCPAAETSLAVELTAVRTTVVCGPYARFAQKYFGAIAPLADKTAWTLESARVRVAGPGGVQEGAVVPVPVPGFPKVLPDRMQAADMPLEQAARDAAGAVYAMRRHRLDMFTGEADASCGAGEALAEISRMEEEYLGLFFGIQRTDTVRASYGVTPERGRNTYIICRFSDAAGLLSASDLGGQPVTLDVRPQPSASGDLPQVKLDRNGRPAEKVTVCTVPARTVCTVSDGRREIGRAQLPVAQLGREVMIPAGR